MPANTPRWLQAYFGDKFEEYSPVALFEGTKHAVVKITKRVRGSSAHGYILVRMDGSFMSSSHESLHEGVASGKDVQRMLRDLRRKDG